MMTSKLLHQVRKLKKRHYYRFVRNGYDEVLLRGLTLGKDSTVLDIGGYRGDLSNKVYEKFEPYIHVFEPVPVYNTFILERFKQNNKIKVHPYGLSELNELRTFFLCDEATGERVVGKEVLVPFHPLSEIFQKLPNVIDLVVINIEGGEYELIKLLHKTNEIKRIRNILIQFHRFNQIDTIRYLIARVRLRKNFKTDWRYRFVWEKWSKKC
jgi:FkbM family methyltransferase